MNCDDALNLISAKLDGELAADQRAPLEEHLASCPPCREAADALALQNAYLARAFAPRRRAATDLAERVIARLPSSGVTRVTARRSFWAAWSPVIAAAAGFAVALMIFRPWERPVGNNDAIAVLPTTATKPAEKPIAQLALATGLVEFKCPGDEKWQPLATGGPVPAGTAVRTGPKVRCEFRMNDGSEVRLNTDSRATLEAPRRIEVAAGQVFSTVAKAMDPRDQFVVKAAPADVSLVALGTAFDVSCSAKDSNATLTVVEGSVKVQGKAGDEVLKAGEAISLAGGRASDRKQVHNLMQATQWVDEILVMKGRDNQELARRMDDMFALLGLEKMNFMAEAEIRRLGDHCVVPLTRYIQSDRSRDRDRSRHTAARIVADVATTSSIPELINLLSDHDGEVRYHAARALGRLTGGNNGRPEQFRDESLMQCAPRIHNWHEWWAQNRSRYPGADPDAVRPMEIPKGKG